jgi:ABC-type transporter Mla MlaB component
MSEVAVFVKVNDESVITCLQEAQRGLDGAQGEAVLDFSSVRRIDAGGLRALDDFARLADEKAIRVLLRGVNVDLYRVLKLVKLTQRLSFINDPSTNL